MNTDNITIVRWEGIRDSKTNKICAGRLWLRFNLETTLLNVNPNTIGATPTTYNAGQLVGFSIDANNKKEGIYKFFLFNQIVH